MKLFKLILSGITLFLFGTTIGLAAITAQESPHGGFFFSHSASQAVLTLSQQKNTKWKQKGTLKLINCEITIQPENSWHVETILLNNYGKMFFSYSGLDVPAILSGSIKQDGKDVLVAIPLELDKAKVDGNALIYNKVKTYMSGTPQNLVLNNAHLIVYPPRIHHGRAFCPGGLC